AGDGRLHGVQGRQLLPDDPQRCGPYRNAPLRRHGGRNHGRRSESNEVMKIQHRDTERHVLTITVDNEAGILAKIAGLFTARGYNIDSLTVADISENHQVSRITIVTKGSPQVIDQIEAQLERLVPVHRVVDLTQAGPHVERELALIKVS